MIPSGAEIQKSPRGEIVGVTWENSNVPAPLEWRKVQVRDNITFTDPELNAQRT